MNIIKKFAGTVVPFLFFHLICCGSLIIFLTTSGYLLFIRQEADKRIYLIPIFISAVIFLGIHWYYGKCCERKGNKTFFDRLFLIMLYISFSFLLGLIFMIYVFIPWWIPNYKGGILLP